MADHAARWVPVPADPACRKPGWADRWPSRAHLELAPGAAAPRHARRRAREVLWDWHLEDIADDCEVVISELVTNAVEALPAQRGRPAHPVHLWLLSDGRQVAVLVADGGPAIPALRDPAPGDEHGRGLLLVDALSKSWGWYPTPAGKVVWSVLDAATCADLAS